MGVVARRSTKLVRTRSGHTWSGDVGRGLTWGKRKIRGKMLLELSLEAVPPYFIKENRIKDCLVFDFKVMDSFQQVLSMALEGFMK